MTRIVKNPSSQAGEILSHSDFGYQSKEPNQALFPEKFLYPGTPKLFSHQNRLRHENLGWVDPAPNSGFVMAGAKPGV